MICTTASLSFLLSAQRRHNLRHRLDLLTTVCIASAEQQRFINLSFCGIDQRFRDAIRCFRRITVFQTPEASLHLHRSLSNTL